jgi:hypothetical protein
MLTVPGLVRADFVVAPGWDLFATQPGTFFDFPPIPVVLPMGMLLALEGVPLEEFAFGGTIGTRLTGSADTIVQRLAAADSGGMPGTAPPIPIEMVALHLRDSTGLLHVTLQSQRQPTPGPASDGTMTVSFLSEADGEFTSSIDVLFDIRTGSATGPIVGSGSKTVTSTATPWSRLPPSGSLEIIGVNILLKNNGTRDQDFWPTEIVEEDSAADVRHIVSSALAETLIVPATTPWGLAALALLLSGLGIWTLLRLRRHA